MKNVGLIPIQRGSERWRHDAEEKLPSGAEFEEALVALDYFIRGYFVALRVTVLPLYVNGDFFGERTLAIYVENTDAVTDDLVRLLTTWLKVPRWESWRVTVIVPESKLELTVYADGLFLGNEYFEAERARSEWKRIFGRKS